MATMGVFYASAGGNTTQVAEALKEAFELEDDACVLMEDFDSVEQFEAFDVLFVEVQPGDKAMCILAGLMLCLK